MGVVGGGFRNVCLKSLAAACSLPIPSSSSSSQSSPPNGASRRSAQIGGGLWVVLLAGESLVLLAVGGMLAPPLLHASPPSLYLAERGWCRNARGMLSRVRERRELPPLILDFGHVEFPSPIS